jgi:hypothetical protein
MSGSRYVTPYDQYIYGTDRGQLEGLPIAGGLLHFYAGGTSTPQPTYNDTNLTIPNPNPIILDSAGNPGSVFLTGGVVYRVVLIDPDGNTIFDMDDVVSFAPST